MGPCSTCPRSAFFGLRGACPLVWGALIYGVSDGIRTRVNAVTMRPLRPLGYAHHVLSVQVAVDLSWLLLCLVLLCLLLEVVLVQDHPGDEGDDDRGNLQLVLHVIYCILGRTQCATGADEGIRTLTRMLTGHEPDHWATSAYAFHLQHRIRT